MRKLAPALGLCVFLALAATSCGESTPTSTVPTPTATVPTPTSAVSTPSGTVKVSTPGVTVGLRRGGVGGFSVASGTPVMVPTGTHLAVSVTCMKVLEKDGKKETWSIHAGSLGGKQIPFKVTEGEDTTLNVGPPLVAKVTVGKVVRSPATADRPEERSVGISLDLAGQAGEVYRFIHVDGKLPSVWPSFSILDEKGVEIGEGKIDYG